MDRYDPQSGLVYCERTFKHRAITPWEHQCGTGRRSPRRKPYRSPQGTDSLRNIVLRKLVRHAKTLTSELLRAMPPTYVEMIWKAIRRESQDSLHVWKTFVNAGYVEGMPQHHAALEKRYKPLVEYYLDMTSKSFAWLVDLDLIDLTCSPAEMKSIAELCNLQNLFVGYAKQSNRYQQTFDDAVMEGLATRASSEGALSRLRMLFIQNAKGISKAAFAILHKFQALDLFCAIDTKIHYRHRVEAKSHGWEIEENSPFSSYTQSQKLRLRYANAPKHAFFHELAKGYIRKRRSTDANHTAVLTCSMQTGRDGVGTWLDCEDWDQSVGFERKWEVTKHKASHTIRDKPDELLEGQPAAKKRKIKEGRVVGLDQLLATH